MGKQEDVTQACGMGETLKGHDAAQLTCKETLQKQNKKGVKQIFLVDTPPSHGTAGNRSSSHPPPISQALTIKQGCPSHSNQTKSNMGRYRGFPLQPCKESGIKKYSWLRSPLAVNFLNHFHRGRKRNAHDLRDESK